MIIIAERINSTRKEVFEALKKKDKQYFQHIAKLQEQNGANYIDINCATMMSGEASAMEWLVSVIGEVVALPLCIDSPNPKAIEIAVTNCKVKCMINSITLEKARYEAILPLVKKYETAIIALAMDENGIPADASARIAIIKRIADIATDEYKIDKGQLYIDPIIQPISTDSRQGQIFLDTLKKTKEAGIKAVCGLSNISYGLPKRSILNSTFFTMAIQGGLDAAIVDCLNKDIIRTIKAAEALTGKDQYCANYLNAYRKGLL